jgi:iron complex transport system permease protein
MPRHRWLTPLLVIALPLSLLFALTQGSVAVSPADVWHAFAGNDSGVTAQLLRELRLPRALAAIAVGGLLALAGALLQVLLRNPLADPYVLGVSGGASVAALLAMLAGVGGIWISGSAALGALGAILLVFGLSHGASVWTRERLLLTGAVTAAGFGALTSLILTLASDTQLPGMLHWLLGDLSGATHPWPALAILVVALLAAVAYARPLNVLARGETVAAALGENPAHLRIAIYFIASVCTALAVTLAGAVGFVGLVVPHLLRLVGGSDHRHLLPNCVLFGGCFLVIADTLARTVVAPVQLPVGVLTALIGVPAFLVLLARGR